MNYGLLSVILIQVALCAVVIVYAERLKNIQSAYGREQVKVETKVSLAVDALDAVRRTVADLELSHYRALQARQLATETEVHAFHRKVASLEESQASLSNKLTSREKIERKAERAATKEDREEVNPAQVSLEELIAQGHAMPMEPARAANGRVTNFGKKV